MDSNSNIGVSMTLDTLPAEIILEIATQLPFTAKNLDCFSRTCPRIQAITSNYKTSITCDIAKAHFPLAASRFPRICPRELHDYTFPWLSEISHREECIKFIAPYIKKIGQQPHYLDEWKWEAWFTVGHLILWRLRDCLDHEEKVEYLWSLPEYSLAILQHTLAAAARIGLEHGAGAIHKSLTEDPLERADVILCFQELLLHHGPVFLRDIICQDEDACDAVGVERFNMDATQTWDPETESEPSPTLISQVNVVSATRFGCAINQLGSIYDQILEIKDGKDLTADKVKCLVEGGELPPNVDTDEAEEILEKRRTLAMRPARFGTREMYSKELKRPLLEEDTLRSIREERIEEEA